MNNDAVESGKDHGPNSAAMQPKLPPDIKIMEFARHRAQELASLTAVIENPGGSNKRIFQQLPRHMRRRAMSHSIKRVPRRLQEIQKRELEKFGRKATKRPSRKHRRRPSQLLQAYNRRQRNFIWLETHIWHAKRFKMISRWGYKIPWHPNDKSIRACYRAATRAVLLQDLSYYCCLELKGERQAMLDVLNKMTNPDCGLTFASKMCSSGCREGSTIVFRYNCYPFEAICPVKFLWRHDVAESQNGVLWVWLHPSGFQTLLDELLSAFNLQQTNGPQKSSDKDKLALLQQKPYQKLAPKLCPFYEKNPVYENETVMLTVLKDTLVRFRLLGQGSTAILAATLKVTEFLEDEVCGDDNDAPWWTKLDSSSKDKHSEQSKMWDELAKYPFASRIAPNSVIGLTVHDPRESLPVMRNKIAPKIVDKCDEMAPIELKPQLSSSALWDQEVRDEVTFTKMTDYDMNMLRSQHLVPGTPLNLGSKGSRVPILLIHQPGNNESPDLQSTGVGWDIILPVGWAMAFWVPFVYRCARVGGYREHETVTRDLQMPYFPDDYPDTSACREVEKQQSKQLVDKYFRYPPDKRPNFVKLGTKCPFSFPWQQLVSEWAESSTSDWPGPPPSVDHKFFVLRSQKLLRRMQALRCGAERRKFQRREHSKNLPKVEDADWGDVLRPEHRFSLVPVRLQIASHGEVSQFSMVCEPTDADLKILETTTSPSGPCEIHHKDDLKVLRKEALENAKKMRKKAKSSENALDAEVRAKLDHTFDTEDNFNKLYVPSSVSIVHSCSRSVVGFAKSGSFSFSRGKTIGFAFVAFPALFRILKSARENCRMPVLMVRSPHSYQYHFAHFDI